MKVKALKSYRWAFGRNICSFECDVIYDVKDDDALEMIKHSYAQKLGIASAFAGAVPVSEGDVKPIFENKKIDVAYKKRGRPPKIKED